MLWSLATGCLIAGVLLLVLPVRSPSTPEAATATTAVEEISSTPLPPTQEPSLASETEEELEHVHMHQEEVPEPFTPAVWDSTAETTALAAGERFMRAWLDPVPQEEWWSALEPLMNINGSEIYSRVDPEQIVPATINGLPTLTAPSSPYYAEVTVPTTSGTYIVALTRHEQGAPWLTERLQQPESTTETDSTS